MTDDEAQEYIDEAMRCCGDAPRMGDIIPDAEVFADAASVTRDGNTVTVLLRVILTYNE